MLYNRAIRKRTDLLFGSHRRMREFPYSRRLFRIVSLKERSLLSVSDGETNTAYSYDSVGRLAKVTSQAGATVYSYDVYGNLAKVVTATGSGIITTTYEYDIMNRLTRLTNFSDANNNGVMDEGEGVSQFDYALDALGKKTHATETFWFDNNEDGVKDVNVNNIDWTYDQQSRLIREVFDHYDDQFDQTLDWTYDSVGNRLTQNLDKGNDSVIDEVTRYYYDANDRLIDELFDSQNDGTFEKTTTYGYDKNQQTAKTVTENGIITSDSTFEYNALGQLSVVTITKYTEGVASSIERTTYGYGSDGIRVSALQEIDSNADGVYDTATLTEYLNDPNNHTGYSQVLKTTEYSIDGETRTVTKEIYYTIGLDQIAQSITAYIDGIAQETDHHYFTYDGHGSTRALLDATAAIIQLYSFDAYGNAVGFDPTEALTEYLYSGEQFDSKIGQQYLRARYYDPATGRFNSLDSFFGNLDDPQSLHKYLYTHADPVNGIDPSGMMTMGGFFVSASMFIINVSRLTTATLLGMTLFYDQTNTSHKNIATGYGGLDVTLMLNKLRDDVISGWSKIGEGLPSDVVKSMKERIIKQMHTAYGSDTTYGWDIDAMIFERKSEWTDSVSGDVLQGTLTYNSFVYPVAEVNYVLLGLINHLAYKDGILPWKTNLNSALGLATSYRTIAGGAIAISNLLTKGQYLSFETIEGKNAWVKYGWEWINNNSPNDPICQSIVFGIPTYKPWLSDLTFYAGGFSG